MKCGRVVVVVVGMMTATLVADDNATRDWPSWRGPQGNGIAPASQQPVMQWSKTQNVVWKTAVAGLGHGSPIVVGDQVLLTTAELDRQRQCVVCLDRDTGRQRWEAVVHQDGLTSKGNKKATLASTTPACDGERIYVNFLNRGAVYTTALTRDGDRIWQTKISNYVVHQGYGSSPFVFESLVIVSADNKGGGAIAALNRETGAVVWREPRPKLPNYVSPVVAAIAGRPQLVFAGCDQVTSFDPRNGKQLWTTDASTTECVTSSVTDGTRVFTSGGYPKNHVSAIRADGSGKIEWQNSTRVYVPSMVVADGYLYAIADAGVAMCWKSDTGKLMWKQRLAGTFSASLVLVGDKLFATNESGKTYIFRADPKQCEVLTENKLGDHVMATPTICGDRIYHRVAERGRNGRQEFVYCLGD